VKQKKKSRFEWLRRAVFGLWMLPDAVLRFVLQWWATRRWLSLVWGLPAIICGLAFLVVEPWHARTRPADRARQFDQIGRNALQQRDLQAASVAFRRIAFVDAASPAACYGLALTAEEQGDLVSARSWMDRIAPETRPGYAPAHFWLATDLMVRETPLSAQEANVLEHHLLQATRNPAYEVQSRLNLIRLYMLRGESEKAITQLELAAPKQPALLLDLAGLHAQAGRTVEARRAALRATEFFKARTATDPKQPLNRQAWAASLVLQERYEEAVSVLAAGLNVPDPEPIHKTMAAVYLQWLVATSTPDKPDVVRQLEFLERILRHDPSNERALMMLGSLAVAEDESAEKAFDLLNQMLARGAAPGLIHLALGTRAMMRGDLEQGLVHLEQALERNARVPEVLNNLAWGLAHREPPDLPRALQLVETAQTLANHPETYDTMGTILAKMGRPREAVTQLENALRVLPPRAEIHRKLCELYGQLGNEQLAAQHQQLAEKLESSPPKPRPN
jgi:tetratricopeptide (TPR) repeat protein